MPLLGYLRGLGVIPQGTRVPQTPVEELLDGYGRWLLAERGLQPTVARGYLAAVRPFVTVHAAGGLAGLRDLT